MTTWAEHVQAVQEDRQGFQIVEIIWEDCASFGVEWTDKVETEPRITTTVGYLVAENDRTISVVLHVNTEHVGNGAVIPYSAILSWRDLT
jgi:hypothetical protein